MFTDTKNLANLTVNTTIATAKQINTHIPDEDKFKLKKMWKPILRLMSRKSDLARNGKRDINTTIPNNINLNNATHNNSSINKDSIAALEDNSYMTRKLALAELWQTQQQQQQQQYQISQQETSTEPLEFISKASIDKTPLDICTNCVYGRNCQHARFHQTDLIDSNLTNLSYLPAHETQLSFNYFDAEDGCFVWSENTDSDIDENALREWLWRNSWQLAENATMC